MTNILKADTSSVSVVIDSAAHELRARLLNGASFIDQVSNPAEQEIAVSLCRDIKRLLSDVEASRKAVKAPVLDLGKTIDEKAKSFTTGLLSAMEGISKLVTTFQEAERVRVALEERARADAIALAEAERLARLEEAKTAEKTMATEEDLARAVKAEADAKAAEEAARAVIVAPLPEVHREAGMRIRRVPVVEVVDIHEVYRANPGLVRLELNLSEFNARIVEGMSVPGLKITWENKTSFRT